MGISNFAAVINPPQSGIIAIGKTEKQPLYDPNVKDTNLRWADVMKFTVSFDHRIIDGALGSQWISKFKNYIENPLLMFV